MPAAAIIHPPMPPPGNIIATSYLLLADLARISNSGTATPSSLGPKVVYE
jgi:hypothetical protein